MNINKVLEKIKDTSRDYVGTNGCLYQDITREELDLIVNEIERLNNIIKYLKNYCYEHEEYEITKLIDQLENANVEWLENALKEK